MRTVAPAPSIRHGSFPDAAPLPTLTNRFLATTPVKNVTATAAIAADNQGVGFGLGTLFRWVLSPLSRGKAVATPTTPFPYDAQHFMVGANLPWVNYGGDFGANAWAPQGGLSVPANAAKLDAALARMEAAGVGTVRWWLFGDGRAGIRFSSDGMPLGLDDFVLPDLDVAVAAAKRHHIRLCFAVIDFGWFQAAETAGGVTMRGHADVAREAAKRTAFMTHVLAPVLDRVGHDPTVWAWDLVNEPEWAVFGLGSYKPAQSVAASEMRDFMREGVALVHEHTNQLATVGSASTLWLDLVTGLGLDFYQPHWYDHFESFARLDKPVADFKLDRPVILGEFPTKGSKRTVGGIMSTALHAGYAGGWGWAMLSTDTATDFDSAEPALRDWQAGHQTILAPNP